MKFSAQAIIALSAAVSGVMAEPADHIKNIQDITHIKQNAIETRDGLLPGCNDAQTRNARAIMQEVANEGLGKAGCLCAITTALTESYIGILANHAAPESLNFLHDGLGADNDSVGIFQQRVQWYTNLACDMDAACSAKQFLAVMKTVPGWETMETGALCQAVQRSEKPDAYSRKIGMAIQICAAGGFP
ncbi:hypothetical protein ESCO_002914 [Escovopsis weberi]|uniref:Uncharacterized protein n=1 Tax=Escovopsis weberi TaxID=150374 RepID=A0A0M8N243_ESCWE|nr:hypothetical protein ESCO_002914 [Escovopsis weberi]